MYRLAIILAAFWVLVSVPATAEHESHVMVLPAEITWSTGPASLPPGSKLAVIEGDPSREGPFTMRAILPAGYTIPPHWHPAVEHVTVLSGCLYMATGRSLDKSKGKKLTAGGFAVMQPKQPHFAWTAEEETVLQIHGMGPWGITYVNPADDPRRHAVETP